MADVDFEKALSEHEATVRRVCRVMLRENADEIAQEVFLAFWLERDRYQEQGQLRAYLCTIARRKCLSELRRRKIFSLFARQPQPTHFDPRNADDLLRAVQSLPDNFRLPLHVETCARCQQVLQAIAVVRDPPKGSIRGQVMARIEQKRARPFLWLAPIAAAAGVLLFWVRSDFAPRGDVQPITVEIVAQGEGYGVRVANNTDRDVLIGAYLKDADGEQHWIAPYYPVGAEFALVRLPAHTPLHLLEQGVIPDHPAKGHGELVTFAKDQDTTLFEQRTAIEVP